MSVKPFTIPGWEYEQHNEHVFQYWAYSNGLDHEIEAEHEAETKLLNMLGTGKAREKLIEHIKTDTLENMVNFPEHVYENIFSKF